jgi:hypothetical protein
LAFIERRRAERKCGLSGTVVNTITLDQLSSRRGTSRFDWIDKPEENDLTVVQLRFVRHGSESPAYRFMGFAWQ